MRTFIPTAEMDPDATYGDYIAVKDGVIHRSVATRGALHLGAGFRQGATANVTIPVDPTPRPKRSSRQRVESLANRIAMQVQRTGLTESVFREIQAEAWKAGNPVTRDQVVDLAAVYIARAERDLEDQQRKRVTRKDVHRPDPGKQGVVPGQHGRSR